MMRRSLVCMLLLGACGPEFDPPDEIDGPNTALTPDNFRDRFAERFCQEMADCNPSSPCDELQIEAGNDTGCTFDFEQAQVCFDKGWPCVATQSVPYIEVPYECSQAWSCDS